MFIIFVTIFCIANASSPPHVMTIPAVYFTDRIDPVPLSNFYPGTMNLFKRDRARILPFGEPSERTRSISDWMESIPVENRVNMVNKFASMKSFITAPKLIDGWYSKYVLASSFIDVRLLRLLYRFAGFKLLEDELNIQTACDIVDHMRNKFPGFFEYLTPEYILGWYSVLGSHHKCGDVTINAYSYRGSRNQVIKKAMLSHDESLTVYISMSHTLWSACILRPRIQLLLSTGYEYSN